MPGSESNKLIKTRKAFFVASAARRQKGAYAVEFAVVFIAFFLVLYGMITYGLIFAAQQSMNFAAESGARAGLQWAESLDKRKEKAGAVASSHVKWINNMTDEAVKITVNTSTDPNKLEVVIRYPYGEKETKKLVPELLPSPIMSIALPKALESRSSVDLDIALD